jgi:hypothetical protein
VDEVIGAEGAGVNVEKPVITRFDGGPFRFPTTRVILPYSFVSQRPYREASS